MSSPSSLTSNGFLKPKATMLFAIWRICLAECVLELCELGLTRLIDNDCTLLLFSLIPRPGAQSHLPDGDRSGGVGGRLRAQSRPRARGRLKVWESDVESFGFIGSPVI